MKRLLMVALIGLMLVSFPVLAAESAPVHFSSGFLLHTLWDFASQWLGWGSGEKSGGMIIPEGETPPGEEESAIAGETSVVIHDSGGMIIPNG